MWVGTEREVKWESFKSKVQFLSLFNEAPKAILEHLGGNDFESSSICQIINMTRKGIRLFSLGDVRQCAVSGY